VEVLVLMEEAEYGRLAASFDEIGFSY